MDLTLTRSTKVKTVDSCGLGFDSTARHRYFGGGVC